MRASHPGAQACSHFTFESESGFSRCCRLSAHHCHKLAHGSQMTRWAAFDPGLIAVRGFFQVCEEQLIRELLAARRHEYLGELPSPEKLAARLLAELLVYQSGVT